LHVTEQPSGEWPIEGGEDVREFGREGKGCSIISTQTLLGFRVRECV